MVQFYFGQMETSDPIPHVDVQKDIITEKMKTPVREGQTWYIVNSKWFDTFKKFIGLEEKERNIFAINPGPIDNSILYDETKVELKDGLFEDVDFVFVPADVWDMLVSWYGLMEDQTPIAKRTYTCGAFVRHFKIEVYKLELFLCDNFDMKNSVVRKFSRSDPVRRIDEVAREIFHIPQEYETRLWGFYARNTPDLLNMENSLQEEALDSKHDIVIEYKPSGGQWSGPAPHKRMSYSPATPGTSKISPIKSSQSPTNADKKQLNRPCSTSMITTRSAYLLNAERIRQPCEPGLCGLCNLGNTCFMNSVLQCMSNSPPITKYFMDGQHLLELNESNPLGMRGEIAKAFGDLMQLIWSGRCSSTVPNAFKVQVGRFAPQFSGYQQHDSQELLTFLLDGLHEDLNRIKQKPYIELTDSNGRPDEVVAEESWLNYLKRNDSIIVDVFHGLLKSRVVCPECEKVSITFDPFVYLSLPLPLKKDLIVQLRHIPYDQNQEEADYRISIPKTSTVRDLCAKLSSIINATCDKIIIAEINRGHFHKFFGMEEPLEKIEERDIIYVYDLPCSADDPMFTIVPVVLWEAPEGDKVGHYLNSLFGIPFLVVLPQQPISYQKLVVLVTKRLSRHCQILPETTIMNGERNEDLLERELVEATQKLFQMFVVNTSTFGPARKIPEDESLVKFTEVLGREILALQWKRKVRMEMYKDLQITFHDTNLVPRNNKIKVSLEDCLNLFTTTEKLGPENEWYCPNCKKHERATKKFDLWKLPQILIFHLKRFSYTRVKRDKLDAFVEFPMSDFHMEEYVINKDKGELIYDLIGVCNHYGNLGGGHYTAYCKNNRDKRWYSFDDNSVTPMKQEQVISPAAYVLFYMKREPKPSNIPCTVTSESVPMESE